MAGTEFVAVLLLWTTFAPKPEAAEPRDPDVQHFPAICISFSLAPLENTTEVIF